jgi:hypothetical protein
MQGMSPDMEDLMRKASEAYPLKETGDRWDEIASKINVSKPELEKHFRYKKHLTSLILLFLFLFLGLSLMKIIGKDKLSKTGSAKTRSVAKKMEDMQKTGTTEEVLWVFEDKKSTGQNDGRQSNRQEKFREQHPVISQQQEFGKTITYKKLGRTEKFKDKIPVAEFNTINEWTLTSKLEKHRMAKIDAFFNHPEFTLNPKALPFDLTPSRLSFGKKKNAFYHNRFYYGITAGTDFNSIKAQGSIKSGWNIGFVGGYYFNKKISIETGLRFSQKYYSTMGDYFSTKVIGPAMPAAMKIMEVDGFSKIIEIPVALRYDFIQNYKGSFFTSAGFSSYILTKEDNEYHTYMNGAEEMMYGTYKNNKQYFAASVDFGMGYSRKLGNRSYIRIQPYVQIPLKGIGVGDLQIMSTGLRIGLTRQAH